MASDKDEIYEEDSDWEEEVVMMMELPNGANLNASKKDLCLQVAGMWTEKPVVKLDNMLYVGNVSETMGSHLFIECKKGDGSPQSNKKKNDERLILTANTNIKLDPVYLEKKMDQSSNTPAHSSKDSDET